jgi:DNA-binding SARP family transcriptional activator
MASLSTPWVDARREEIEDRLTGARLEAARILFRLGKYRESQEQVDLVLGQDPYREQAWRLTLSLAQASGNDDAVLARFRRYVDRMRELGMPPSADIHRLVRQLRT